MKYFLGSSAIQKLWEYGMIFLLCVLCINVPLHAEDEEECWNDSLLKIITKTEQPSAEFVLNIHRDEEKAYERTEVGIGERFKLILSGKLLEGQNAQNVKNIKWHLLSGQEYLKEWPKNTDGRSTLNVEAKKEFLKDSLDEKGKKKDGKVVVQAELNGKRTKKLEIEVLFPEKMWSKHAQGGVPASFQDELTMGASMLLELRVQPLKVSFVEIDVIERDLGSFKDQGSISESIDPRHTPATGCDARIDVLPGNKFWDRATSSVDVRFVIEINGVPPLHKLPQKWHWACQWRVHYGGGGLDSKNKDGAVIVEENQYFVFEKLALANGHSYLNSSINKFGCFVTRNTLNLRYFFGPEEKK